jgi:hypothetical protein
MSPLFYLYGRGIGPKSILAKQDTALENNYSVFNMSGQEGKRFFTSTKAAEYIVTIAAQKKITGIYTLLQ